MRLKKLFALIPFTLLGIHASAIEQIDGVYQISTAEDMTAFAELVNAGEATANAVLTHDIDFSEYNVMLGDGTGYAGTFDGQGHTVTINQGHTVTINISGGEDGVNYVAFVRELDGGTIQNLILKGNLASASLFAGGIVGHTKINTDARNVIRNVVSEVNMTQTGPNGQYGDVGFGGFVGHIQNALI